MSEPYEASTLDLDELRSLAIRVASELLPEDSDKEFIVLASESLREYHHSPGQVLAEENWDRRIETCVRRPGDLMVRTTTEYSKVLTQSPWAEVYPAEVKVEPVTEADVLRLDHQYESSSWSHGPERGWSRWGHTGPINQERKGDAIRLALLAQLSGGSAA